jgi:hypothetical protein
VTARQSFKGNVLSKPRGSGCDEPDWRTGSHCNFGERTHAKAER